MCIEATPLVESRHPEVVAFAHRNVRGVVSQQEQAVALFYAVRDGVRYDPYTFDISSAALRASRTLETRRSWCVPKAILLAACCRAVGIPARLGFADVRNHLSTERLRQMMGTDIFAWHGYTSIEIGGQWLKATPAFNLELCEKFRLRPLEFDGTCDAVYHPFDLTGNRHMEYIRFHGEYDDVPHAEMAAGLRKAYPALAQAKALASDANFDADVDAEMRRRSPTPD
jgi:transglutaminase-like putative cysteine protease